jgi:hypothetical protein
LAGITLDPDINFWNSRPIEVPLWDSPLMQVWISRLMYSFSDESLFIISVYRLSESPPGLIWTTVGSMLL